MTNQKLKIYGDNNKKISIMSSTAQFALNVFEGIRVYKTKNGLNIFRAKDHLKRLLESAEGLYLNHDYSLDMLENILYCFVEDLNLKGDTALRVILAVTDEGSWSSSNNGNLFIVPSARPHMSSIQIGAKKLCVVKWQRISSLSMPPHIKCGANYINSRLGFFEARNKGFDYPIFINSKGFVSESSGACIVLIKDNKLITPPVDADILNSITRDCIKNMASILDFEWIEKDLKKVELFDADEAFLCGTAAEITPIGSIDDKLFGSGGVGLRTQKISDLYEKIVRNQTTVFIEWNHEI